MLNLIILYLTAGLQKSQQEAYLLLNSLSKLQKTDLMIIELAQLPLGKRADY